ncbi:MAG: class I SAM-dependent methyltransferase [Ignavibacteria bacterium]|nr:class I SAM-dependent methyltransferase [Ignavibacteria bacterium]
MQNRHQTPDLYFREQSYTTSHHVIPFIREVMTLNDTTRVLEVGCGHGGNVESFLDIGCETTGLDINPDDIRTAESFLAGHPNRSRLTLISTDIYDANVEELGRFDLIVMKDVIEHIHDQTKFMGFIKTFLNEKGRIFLGFPPWYMPFGGHQQVCESRFLSILPFFHLLPVPLYRSVLRMFGESKSRVEELLEVKETGISIERFRRIIINEGYRVDREQFFLISPNYEIKFKMRPVRQIRVLSSISFLRNFLTTCCYYLVRKGPIAPID